MGELNSIFVYIFSTTVIVSTLGFVLKKSFEKLLDNKLKHAQEEHKVTLVEHHRRQGEIFNQRFDTLKTAISLAYRSRNKARELSKNLNVVSDIDENNGTNSFKALRVYYKAIGELLYDERGILPDEVFLILHELKHDIENLIELYSRRYREKGKIDKIDQEKQNKRIKDLFLMIDSKYEIFLQLSQALMGLESVRN